MDKVADNSRAERFEVAFNRIHQELRKLVKDENQSFSNLVYKGSKSYTIVRQYQSELQQFSRLRNAIVHERYELGEYIAEPNEKTVSRIEKIAKVLSQPNHALTIATKEVIIFDYADSLEKLVTGINNHSYSQYPVYREDSCVGVITAKLVVKWMAANLVNSKVDLSKFTVGDVFNADDSHPIAFVSKSKNIFELEEIFEEAHLAKQDLEGVIITENGRQDEKPLGIVTPWDLIEIDYKLD
ncbi:CBS domain-containing protein [Virgibacillus kekensis]|uniref:CBS domain-containing protein n=1 Tax=Virgibacillus kekensis TaxID=202261 RepID=A0ABV9DHJ9_9BACI